jgi:GPH family glycoside/pentoside/hexuronide:cation symporter
MTVPTTEAAGTGARTGPLPLRVKLGYGASDIAGSVFVTLTGFYLTAFLLDVAGLRPAAVAAIFLIAQVWDAVIDPVIGVLADRTETRWGRKRAWVLFGAVPVGAAFVLQWTVPGLGPVGTFVWFLVVSLLVRTAMSAVGIPLAAIQPDLTADYDERTQLNRWKMTLNLLGSMTALATFPLLSSAGDVRQGYQLVALVWGAVMVTVFLVAYRVTWERPLPAGRPPAMTWSGVFSCLRNRPFLYATGVFLFSWLTILFVQNNLLLYVRYTADVEAHFTPIILAFQVTAIVAISGWAALSRRVGKRAVFVAGAVIWAAGLLSLYWAPEGVPGPYYAAAVVIGLGAGVAYLVPWSLLPDVMDHGELLTGERREGTYAGTFVLLQQVGLSLGLAASSLVLEFAGYVNPEVAGEPAAQPDAVAEALRVLVSIVPLAFLAVAVPLILAYPITRARHVATLAELAERRDARLAATPPAPENTP